jgi:hypothetical protein
MVHPPSTPTCPRWQASPPGPVHPPHVGSSPSGWMISKRAGHKGGLTCDCLERPSRCARAIGHPGSWREARGVVEAVDAPESRTTGSSSLRPCLPGRRRSHRALIGRCHGCGSRGGRGGAVRCLRGGGRDPRSPHGSVNLLSHPSQQVCIRLRSPPCPSTTAGMKGRRTAPETPSTLCLVVSVELHACREGPPKHHLVTAGDDGVCPSQNEKHRVDQPDEGRECSCGRQDKTHG